MPVLLTVQIDSVGRGDEMIPANVRTAANFYQNTGKLIHGASNIRAEDPDRTAILFNRRIDYRNRHVQVPNLPWYKKAFRIDHVKMDNDPEVWHAVEQLILRTIGQKNRSDSGDPTSRLRRSESRLIASRHRLLHRSDISPGHLTSSALGLVGSTGYLLSVALWR